MNRRLRNAGLTAAMSLGLALVFSGSAEAGGGFGKKKSCGTPAYATGCHTPKIKMPKMPKLGCGGGLKMPKLGCGKKKATCAPAPVVYAAPHCDSPAPMVYGGQPVPSAQVMGQPQGMYPGYGAPVQDYGYQGGYPQDMVPPPMQPGMGMGMPGMPAATLPGY